MTESAATYLDVGDIVIIPELHSDRRHLITNTEPPGSAVQIDLDEEGYEQIGLPGTLPEGLRTFIKVGHWAVERTLAVQARSGPLSKGLETIIRASYGQPPYEVPHE